MAINLTLLQQIKQAMHKQAAPPAEVTEGKPYVRPENLNPEQPAAIDPQSGIRRDVTERLLKDRIEAKQDADWENNVWPSDSYNGPDFTTMTENLRQKYKLEPLQLIADKPEALKEYRQTIKPLREKAFPIHKLFDGRLLDPQEYADYEHFYDQGDFPLHSPQGQEEEKGRKLLYYNKNVRPLEQGFNAAQKAIRDTNYEIDRKLGDSISSAARVKDVERLQNKPTFLDKLIHGDYYSREDTPEMKRIDSQIEKADSLRRPYYSANYKPLTWASSLPLRAALGYATPSKPVVTQATPASLGRMAADSLKAFPYADRGYGGFYPRVDPRKPATKPNIPYTPASHMGVDAPMSDRRLSRVELNAAKPAPPVQQPTTKAPASNLPAIPDTPANVRRLGGGKGY